MNIYPESFDFLRALEVKMHVLEIFRIIRASEHGKTPKEVFKIITLGGYICSNNATIWLKSLGKFFFQIIFKTT